MAEPTLGEIAGGRVDPEIATGQPAVIYDNSQLLKTLNDNAQFKAQNDWNKYRQFLGDYETRLKNQQEIADKEVSEADREYLKKRSIELFKDVANDPYKIYDPEFNTKLSGLRADATASKQDRDFAEKHAQFMMLHPEWSTDENKKLVNDYMTNQTLEKGGRKPFTLTLPDQMDYMKYFDALKQGTLTGRNENVIKDGIVYNREYAKYDKDKFLNKVALAYDSDSRIKRKADKDFSELSPELQAQFGTPQNYWKEFGAKHFSEGDANERLISEKLAATPNYAKDRELSQEDRKIGIMQQNADTNLIEAKKRGELIDAQIKNYNKTGEVGGAIDFWGQRIAPQIPKLSELKQKKDRAGWWTGDDMVDYPVDYTGDSDEIPASTIADLGVILTDEKNEDGKPVTITDKSKIKIRYQNGQPIGIVFDGQLYDANVTNRKAIQLHDKYVNNKTDISPLIGVPPSATENRRGVQTPPKKVTVEGL